MLAAATQSLAADLIKTTLSQVGSSFSERPRTPAEIVAYADALADMLCAYLERLMRQSQAAGAAP